MRLVKTGLFIGTRADANNGEKLKKYNIYRILTVDSQMHDRQRGEGNIRLHVYCLDESTSDLLTSFDRCIQFIEEGLRNNEPVLVHCLSGVSRSVTVVLAYLMKTESISLDTAVFKLNQVYFPDEINPNPGFLDQLRLYGVMGNTVDEYNPVFNKFRLKLLAKQIKENGHADDDLLSKCVKEVNSTITNTSRPYKCKKCRITLFHSSNVVEHESSVDHVFSQHKRAKTYLKDINNAGCTSVFTEPVDWMSFTLLGSVEGKLLCPHCKCRLGSFKWSGMQCSCGSWVTPAFQFHANKIDKVFNITLPGYTCKKH